MIVSGIEQGYISEMPILTEEEIAGVRAEMPLINAPGPMRSPMPTEDNVGSDLALSFATSQIYQAQQSYLDIVRRMEIGAVGLGERDSGILLPPYEVSLLRATETIVDLTRNGWKAVLPYNPYIYHNYMWKQPQERISFIW